MEIKKSPIHIDTANNVYEVNGKDIGDYCTGVEIKITPGDLPEVTLHFKSAIDVKSEKAEIQTLFDGINDKTDDKIPATVETSDK